LVEGDSINDAVAEMSSLLNSGNPTRNESRLWAVVYLGTKGSQPPYFKVSLIEKTKKTLKFIVEQPKSVVRSADRIPYVYFIPMGKTDFPLTIELFDKDNNVVALSRVVITK
jgi:hypothetical protein